MPDVAFRIGFLAIYIKFYIIAFEHLYIISDCYLKLDRIRMH